MIKLILCVVTVLVVATQQVKMEKLTCALPQVEIPKEWITMVNPCVQKMREQVQIELTASMTYFAMGAHFSKDTVNRPGFAKLFFESASEERAHAIKIIGYLLMRGEITLGTNSSLIQDILPVVDVWADGLKALENALLLEARVTRDIKEIVKTCENDKTFNDHHLVDWLIGDFLTEQYEGQRNLAGKISTLSKMNKSHGVLGEFLFDKKLLD